MTNLGDGAENWPLARDYDAAEDGRRSYDFGIRCRREIAVRAKEANPDSLREWRWWDAGPVPYDQLETVRNG